MYIKNNNLILSIITLMAFIFLSFQSPEFQPDSGSYESYSSVRIGLYPFTISFFKWLFASYAFQVLAVFQSFFVVVASLYFTNFLQKKFSLNAFISVGILVVLLFPCVTHCKANAIISESVAYPLFLFSALQFCKMVFNHKNKYIFILVVAMYLLTFTRQQFIALYVVMLIYGFYIFYFEKQYKYAKKIFIASILSISCFFISERTYHLFFHGSFAGTPFVGTQLLMRPIFIASGKSLTNFEEPKQQNFINKVTENLKSREIIAPDSGIKEITAYEYFYNTMYHVVSAPIWGGIWTKDSLNKELETELSDFQVLQIIDKNCLTMSLKLIKENIANFSMHYTKDVIRGMGGYMFIIFLAVMFLTCLYYLLCVRIQNNKPIFILVSLATFMHLGNSALVCLFEPPLTRYTYATASFLAVTLIIFLLKTINQFQKNIDESCVA